MQKTPYMVIIGEKEALSQQVAIRSRAGEDLGAMPLGKFVELLDKDGAH